MLSWQSFCLSNIEICQAGRSHAAGPVLPLSERPVQSRVSKDDLLAWHAAALAQAEAVGSAFEDADGGPSAEDLKVWPPFCFHGGHEICLPTQPHPPTCQATQF